MDPKACLDAWLTEDDPAERAARAADYNAWVDRGGFPAIATLKGSGHKGAVTRMGVDHLWCGGNFWQWHRNAIASVHYTPVEAPHA